MPTKNQSRKSMLLGTKEIMSNISDAITELTGDDIAKIHNEICARKIRYTGDDIWEYTGEID
jgi:hypothetical protein